MQTHETPSFKPAASSLKNNLPAPRPFEDTHSGQELDSLSTNPFPPRPHEVWMGEPRGGSTNPFPRRPHEVDMGEPKIARKPISPPVQAEATLDPEANPFIFGNRPFRMNAPDAPPPPPRRWGIQAKVAIGQPNDVYEQEADRVAEQVMGMSSAATSTVQRQAEEEEPEEIQTKPLAETITPLVQRQADLEKDEPIQAKCEDCEAEEPIQRFADGTAQAQPDLENRLNASQGGGSALPEEVRSFMEPRFGADFSQVRVHTGSEAIQMNRDLNAQAFTHGHDVYFGSGKTPGSNALTAHELTHVVQQTGAVRSNLAAVEQIAPEHALSRKVGWSGSGPNAGRSTASRIDRIPIEDATLNPKQALILLPQGLDPKKPVQALLHFHGLNVGNVQNSPRDLDAARDRFEEQMNAALQKGNPQLIGVLPQSSDKGKSFGNATSSPTGFVNACIAVLNRDAGTTVPKPTGFIASGHSGGGNAIAGLAAKESSTAPPAMQSVFLFEGINNFLKNGVMAGRDKIDIYVKMIARRLRFDVNQLISMSAAQATGYLTSSFQFRAYYGSVGSYIAAHELVDQAIRIMFGEPLTPAEVKQQNQRLKGGLGVSSIPEAATLTADLAKLPPTVKATLRQHYQVIKVDQSSDPKQHKAKLDDATGKMHTLGHENIVGSGALLDALGSIQPKLAMGTFQSLVQRQGASAGGGVTDAQQWDNDWTSHTGQQHYFAGSDRPAGTPRHRYDVLCPLYKAHGIPRPMVYMATSITTAKFYNFSTPAHTNLAAALATAESTLKTKGYTTAPVKSLWALNPRTTSAGGWSNHADGKAVDIDPNDNPHLIAQKERKIITLVTGTDMEKGGQGYDVIKGASDRFKSDYNAAGLNRRITELTEAEKGKEKERDAAKSDRDMLKGQRDTLQTERRGLNQQLKAIPTGKKATADDVAKATALKAAIQQKDADFKQVQTDIKQKDAVLKKKESELKSATQDRKTLQKQLTTYQATEKAIAALESSVKSLPSEITAIEAQINQSKQDEQDAKAAKDHQGVVAQQKLQTKLQQSLKQKKLALKKQQSQLDTQKKQRDADPLRKYAASGFLNLPKDLVGAMTGAGLKWGGDWKGAKDFMHFELP